MKRFFTLLLVLFFTLSNFSFSSQAISQEEGGKEEHRQAELTEALDQISDPPQETEDTSSQKPVSEQKGASQEILVDLDLKDADMKDVARALSRISGKNIIVSDEVKAKVAMRVKALDWQEALYMILDQEAISTQQNRPLEMKINLTLPMD